MKWIYLIVGLLFWMLFAWDIENGRDFWTWIMLLPALACFALTMWRHRMDTTNKRKKALEARMIAAQEPREWTDGEHVDYVNKMCIEVLSPSELIVWQNTINNLEKRRAEK